MSIKSKFNKWLGLATALSPYEAPNGSAKDQTNLQILLPGKVKPRPGLSFYGGDGATELPVFSLYSQPTGGTTPDRLFVHQGTYGSGAVTISSLDGESYTEIYSELHDNYQPAYAEDRHGNIYIFYGHGIKPKILRRLTTQSGVQTEVRNVGIRAPVTGPTVTPTGQGVFIERIDVVNAGGSYSEIPTISFVNTGGTTPNREAVARANVESGRVTSIDVTDGGSNYLNQPEVVVTGDQGKGFLGKAFTSANPEVYSISNFRNYDETNNPPTENNPPVAYSTTHTDAQGEAATPTSPPTFTGSPNANAETYGVVGFDTADPKINVAVKIAEENVAFSSGGSIAISGDKTTTYTNARISYDGFTNKGIFVANAVYSAGNNRTTITLGGAGGLTIGQGTNVTFWQVQEISVGHQPNDQTYAATIDINSSQGAGNGATAAVVFTDGSLNYTIGANTGSVTRGASGWETYSGNYTSGTGISATLLAMQSNPDRMVAGVRSYLNYNHDNWVGSPTGGARTFYFPDWSHVGFYSNSTGTSASPTWTQKKAPLTDASYTTATGTINYAYADVQLEPCTDTPLPAGAVAPTVRIKFAYCPLTGTYDWERDSSLGDSAGWRQPAGFYGWEFSGAYGKPGPSLYQNQMTFTRRWRFSLGFGFHGYSGDNYTLDPRTSHRWYGAQNADGDPYPKPIVDFFKATGTSDDYNDYYGWDNNPNTQSLEVINIGSNIPENTKFQLQFNQMNARHEGALGGHNVTYNNFANNAPAISTQWQRLTFTATQSYSTAAGLPEGIVGTPLVASEGSDWSSTEEGSFLLIKREQTATSNNDLKLADKFNWESLLKQDDSRTDYISSVSILSQGSGYKLPPAIIPRSTNGFGLSVSPILTDGKVTALSIIDGGRNFSATDQPFLITEDEEAQALAIMRPAMQGVYRCAYRFADLSKTVVAYGTIDTTAGSDQATVTVSDVESLTKLTLECNAVSRGTIAASDNATGSTHTVTLSHAAKATATGQSVVIRDMTKPVTYSNFSPIVDVDCGPNANRTRTSEIIWSLQETVPGRVDHVEFYRTSGDQSLVFYRLDMYGDVSGSNIVLQGTDTLNDEELFDATRSNYAAVPVVLPNGNLNAFRFGVPRDDMSVCCAYQDRLFYASATNQESANTIFFSEFDEFESCPEINSLTIQNNNQVNDAITGLVPFGSVLLVMQRSHSHQLTFNTDPNKDAAVALVANRGLLNQQCYDIYENTLYGLDERGVYAMSQNGEVRSLSEPIADFFIEGKIEFAYTESFYVKIDPKSRTLRAFVIEPHGNAGYSPTAQDGYTNKVPTVALCYHLDYGAWWIERYPNGINCAASTRGSYGTSKVIYGAESGRLYCLEGDRDCAYFPIDESTPITMLTQGSAKEYDKTPTLRALSMPQQVSNSDTYDNDIQETSGSGAVFEVVMRGKKIHEIIITNPGFGYGSINIDPSTGVESFANDVIIYDDDSFKVARATALDTSNHHANNNRITIPWSYKTSNHEIINDQTAKGGGGLIDRSVVVTYETTDKSSNISIRQFFNNNAAPRENMMPRDRGTGFVHSTTGAKAVLDMKNDRSNLGAATGVAKAIFAGRATDDLAGSDKHVAVGLYSDATRVITTSTDDYSVPTMYALEVRGVVPDGE